MILLSTAFTIPTLNLLHYDDYGNQMVTIQETLKAPIERDYGVDLDITEALNVKRKFDVDLFNASKVLSN